MLGRFLKRSLPQDSRVHYRRSPGRSDAIGVKLICANGAPVPGTLVDLSAGGAAIEFQLDLTEELQLDEVREVVFSSLTRQSIRTFGQVRSLPREGAPSRYGFMFLETGELFEQLDESFYKFFNRRRFRRAKPALGERIVAELGFNNVLESVDVHDISFGGAGIIVTPDIADMLYVDMPVELRVHVPKTDLSLTHYAIVRHLTPDSKGVRVGMSTEIVAGDESKRVTKKAEAALLDYVQRRIDEIDRYNNAYL